MAARKENPKPSNDVPTHVGIIMDGNGRWAEQHGLSRLEGHRAGAENVRPVAEAFTEYGVRCLTLYAFSTENWSRPKAEVRGLFHLLAETLGQDIEFLHQKGIKLRHLGRLERLPKRLQKGICQVIEQTKDNAEMSLNVAFDYGGRDEILNAVRHIVEEDIPPQAIDETLFNQHLYTSELPELDLLIRTGGEIRLSNFLLWQSAYSELYFTPILWPEFSREEIKKALQAYSQRERHFGTLSY
jgi:undecaprenyl diphosphate synthase